MALGKADKELGRIRKLRVDFARGRHQVSVRPNRVFRLPVRLKWTRSSRIGCRTVTGCGSPAGPPSRDSTPTLVTKLRTRHYRYPRIAERSTRHHREEHWSRMAGSEDAFGDGLRATRSLRLLIARALLWPRQTRMTRYCHSEALEHAVANRLKLCLGLRKNAQTYVWRLFLFALKKEEKKKKKKKKAARRGKRLLL